MKWIATQYGVTLNASFIEKIELVGEEEGYTVACLYAHMNGETYTLDYGDIEKVINAYTLLMNYLEGSEGEK